MPVLTRGVDRKQNYDRKALALFVRFVACSRGRIVRYLPANPMNESRAGSQSAVD